MSPCPSPDELTDLLAGELTAEACERLAAHVQGCAGCQQALDRFTRSDCDPIRRPPDPLAAAVAPDFLRWLAGLSPPSSVRLSGTLSSLNRVSTLRDAVPPADGPGGGPPVGVAGYEVLGELGRGGTGVVYRARHLKLKRLVALKMIQPSALGGEPVARFRTEAETVARLQHPHIVQIYETGEQDGRPYLALEYLDGGSLREKLDGRPQPAAEAARLVETLARAVHHAHTHGIVHRDLKPANVLLTRDGTPKLTDFGLAKVAAVTDSPTRSGDILGTPAYMAPEQTSDHPQQIGPPADVYALGAILYELLTGRTPFRTAHVLDLLLMVRFTEPLPPGRLQPDIPRDLETVCLKCLHKDPRQRYPTALALAEDLRRFVAGEPILARPTPAWEHAWKWARRNPSVAASLGLVLATALVGFLGVTWQWQRAEDRADAEAAAKREVETREQEVEVQKQLAQQAREVAEGNLYYSRIGSVLLHWQAGDAAEARRLLDLGPPERRGWEWHYLRRLCHPERASWRGHPRWAFSVAYSPDGSRLVSAGGIPHRLSGSPAATPGELKVWDAATGRLLRDLPGHKGSVTRVVFSPDGRLLASASADGTVRVWDGGSFAERAVLPAEPGRFVGVAFSADGKTLAVGQGKGVDLWDPATGRRLRTLTCPVQVDFVEELACAFSPDGKWFAAVAVEGTRQVCLWEADTWREAGRIEYGEESIRQLAFSPDGRRLAVVCSSEVLRTWDPATLRPVQALYGHRGSVYAAAYSRDGRRLATAGADRTVRLWDADTGREYQVFQGHAAGVWGVAFHPDGRYLASADQGGVIKTWDAAREPHGVTVGAPTSYVSGLRFADDGRQVLAAFAWDRNVVQSWDAATGEPRSRQPVPAGLYFTWEFAAVGFTPDGRRLAAPDFDYRGVKVCEVATGAEVAHLRAHTVPVTTVALSPDGRRVASAAWDRANRGRLSEFKVWDLASGAARFTVVAHPRPIFALAFAPDGRRVASANMDGTVSLWDADTGEERLTLRGHTGSVYGVAFSPDGRRLASVGRDGTGKVWDAETGRELASFRGDAHLNAVAFSPDGRRLAAASRDVVQLWDAATGQDALILRRPGAARRGDFAFLPGLAFSPDGTRLAANHWYGGITVWDATPPPELPPGTAPN
jgi:WD40 repeat protein